MISLLSLLSAASPGEIPHTPHGCREGLRAASRPPLPGATSLAGSAHPVRVWYDPTHENSALIAPLVIEAVERAWDIQVDTIGFREPVLPDLADGPEFDIYLVDYGPFAAFVSADSYDTDPLPGDGYNGASAFMVVDRELPDIAVPSYLSHEFNHVCQYATDFSEPTLPLWEATATSAQDWTVGDQGYWQYDVPSFQEVPNAPVLVGDSYTIYPLTNRGYTYEYGAAMWVMWLDEVFGDGAGAGGVALWEAAANEGLTMEPDVVDAFSEVTGLSLGDALNAFALARFLTGEDWDPRGLSDAQSWNERNAVPAYPFSGEDLPLSGFDPDFDAMITGQLFFDIDLQGGLPSAAGMGDPWLRVSVASATGLQSGILVATWGLEEPKDYSATGASPLVEIPLGTAGAVEVTRVMVALTNLGPEGWDGEEDPYVFGDQLLSVEVFDRDTPETLPDPEPVSEVEPEEEPKGCGCASAPRSGPWWLVLAVVWLRAARSAARRTGA